jgi:hypothetical protein
MVFMINCWPMPAHVVLAAWALLFQPRQRRLIFVNDVVWFMVSVLRSENTKQKIIRFAVQKVTENKGEQNVNFQRLVNGELHR